MGATAEWTGEAREELESRLALANGRRSARVLTWADVERCVAEALSAELGFAWAHAGLPPDARGVTSLCLAVVRDETLAVGVASAHGDVTPASAWPDLPSWNRYEASANRAALQAWAGRRRDDRVQVTVKRTRPPPPSTPDALLERILSDPDDTASRLVYADLLSELGAPRGEFIALQCAPSTEEGDARADALLAEHGARWVPHPDAAMVLRFERGFVAEVRCLDPEQLDALHRVLRKEPVEHLVLRAPRLFDVGLISAWPEAERLRSLSLTLQNAMTLTNGEDTLRALAARRWPRLEHLSFRGHRLGDDALAQLVEVGGRAFPRLSSLAVDEDTVTAAGLGQLLNAKWVQRLERLSFSENLLGPTGADVIATSRRLSRLTSLSLAGNGLGNAGASTLAQAGPLRSLRALDLRRNRIGASGLESLLDSHHLRGLETLELLGNPIGRAGWSRVRARFGGDGEDA